jgi:methionyl-tRNA formyltransferase
VETLAGLESGGIENHPQDESRATFAPKLTPDDRLLRWERPAAALANQIRGLAPAPGATTRYRGRVLKVFRAEATTEPATAPGTLIEGSRKEPLVATADGALRLLEVAPEGRRRMSGAEFVRGYRPVRGERLG